MKFQRKSEEATSLKDDLSSTMPSRIPSGITPRVTRLVFAVLVALMFAGLGSLAAQAATFHVTTTADNNNNASPTVGSLRKAIVDANANPGTDTIDFNIPGAGVHTFSLTISLPSITDPVVIDGYTQPGASANTLANGDNAVLLIELDGTNPFNFSVNDGLVITAGSSTVTGLIINGFKGAGVAMGSGIKLMTKGQNVIAGNFIGIDSNGTNQIPNGNGILIVGCDNNVIGGSQTVSRNLISGNKLGINIQQTAAYDNLIEGNFIGVNRSGTAGLGNSNEGILINGVGTASSGGVIGGSTSGAGNVISGNGGHGIEISGSCNGLKIQGNFIGTDVTGTSALGNNSTGIYVDTSTTNSAIIGGLTAAARNVVSANKIDGIDLHGGDAVIVSGNYIGTDITGKAGLGNKISGLTIVSSFNSIGGATATEGNVISDSGGSGIYITGGSTGNTLNRNLIGCGADKVTALGNGADGIRLDNGSGNFIGTPGAPNTFAFNTGAGIWIRQGTGNLLSANSFTGNAHLGIDLAANGNDTGVEANDPGDGDTGANNLQNYPVLTAASLISNGLTFVDGTLNSAPNTEFIVEFFANATADPSGFGEGQTFLGSANVKTDANGNGSFTGSFAGLGANQCISTTATDPGLNTSEFSKCKQISSNSPGSLQFLQSAYSVNENGGQATITVKRNGGNFGTITVQYATTAGGTATAGSDYTPVSGTLTWGHLDSSDKTFTIPIIDDSVVEQDETINLQLSNPTNGATLLFPTSALSIVDDDAAPKISINDVSQAEGNSGTTNFTFNVTLSAPSGLPVSANYTTADSTAQTGTDYQAANGVVSFAPGETSKQITVLVNGDTQVEPNETFAVNLFNLINAGVGKASGLGTIVNDDSASSTPTIQFSQASYSVQEDLGALTITVTRSGDTSSPASVDYKTVDGSATQKADFEYAAGTLTFGIGETSKAFQVLINEDMYVEVNESFGLTLSNPAGASLGAQNSTGVTIIDDSPESITNPIDDAQSFVYMQYHDFLNREPDASGLAFWTNQITACGTNQTCIDSARANVSAAFYLSIEFQQTGYLLYLMQKESYATTPKYTTFMRDLQEVGRGVIVNAPGWQQKLADNQLQFAQTWANRPEFHSSYDGMSNSAFVNALYANAGIVTTQADKDVLVSRLDNANETRATALLDVAANSTFRQNEQNNAFVLMEYFGYLRRDPNTTPDSDMSGYNFWLNKLNQFGGNYVDAEMVKAFIISSEYRQRFGQ